MTLKDKKNKREYQNKLKAQGGVKESEKNVKTKENNKAPQAAAKPEKAAVVTNFEGVAENADKLIAEANKRYLAGETHQDEEEDPKYAKRNITSNWTKYELPSSDEEDEHSQSMTGADFNYVLASAQGADSHFRLKSEKEWETHAENGELSQEFFSLDLSELEKSISCLPLHQQICLAPEDFESSMLDRLVRKAEAASGGSVEAAAEAEEAIGQKIMDILNIGKKKTPVELLTDELKESVTVDQKVQEPGKSETKQEPTCHEEVPKKFSDQAAPAPLGQRANRRQRGKKCSFPETVSAKDSTDDSTVDEDRDLKFIDNLDKVEGVTDVVVEPVTKVVPVKIVSEETKNLEDWLDDFLDD